MCCFLQSWAWLCSNRGAVYPAWAAWRAHLCAAGHLWYPVRLLDPRCGSQSCPCPSCPCSGPTASSQPHLSLFQLLSKLLLQLRISSLLFHPCCPHSMQPLIPYKLYYIIYSGWYNILSVFSDPTFSFLQWISSQFTLSHRSLAIPRCRCSRAVSPLPGLGTLGRVHLQVLF